MTNNDSKPRPVEMTAKPDSKAIALAKTSFFLGILSFLFFASLLILTELDPRSSIFLHIVIVFVAWLATASGAVLVSSHARKIIRAGGTVSSRGLAWAGAIMGYINLILILAAIAIPCMLPAPPRRSTDACINNLRQLEGAKEQWAIENNKTSTDTPTFTDLIGTDKYIKVMLICPANGTYTVGYMTTKPRCTIPNHTLP